MSEEEPRGWHVEEYIGVGIYNVWSFVPHQLRQKRRWNKWTQFIGFEFSPLFAEGVYLRMEIKRVNPIARLCRKLSKILHPKRKVRYAPAVYVCPWKGLSVSGCLYKNEDDARNDYSKFIKLDRDNAVEVEE